MLSIDGPIARAVRIVVAVLAVVFGLAMVGLALFVGDCSFAGGRCPQDPEPVMDSDVFRIGAVGTIIAVSIPMWLHTPTWQRFALALGVGSTAGVVVGLVARSAAAG